MSYDPGWREFGYCLAAGTTTRTETHFEGLDPDPDDRLVVFVQLTNSRTLTGLSGFQVLFTDMAAAVQPAAPSDLRLYVLDKRRASTGDVTFTLTASGACVWSCIVGTLPEAAYQVVASPLANDVAELELTLGPPFMRIIGWVGAEMPNAADLTPDGPSGFESVSGCGGVYGSGINLMQEAYFHDSAPHTINLNPGDPGDARWILDLAVFTGDIPEVGSGARWSVGIG